MNTMSEEQLKARVAELEIAVLDMQRVLDNIRQLAEGVEQEFEEYEESSFNGDMIAADIYRILEGYGKPGSKA